MWRTERGASLPPIVDFRCCIRATKRPTVLVQSVCKVIPKQTAKVYIRHRADVHPSWRVLYGGRAWGIQGVSEMGRREGLELLVVAVG